MENTLRIERTRGHLLGLREGLTALEGLPDSIERDEQILTLIETSHGLLGTVRWIDTHLELIRGNESHASFDSELSLVFWPDYPLIRWRPNLLHYSFDGKTVRDVRLTLMVSRIEAPTIELARKLVDNALAVEKKGLQGKVYIDARGQRGQGGNPQRGSIVEQDQSLRNLAKLLEDHTDLDVTLDNNDDLFQAGDCPDASIYCGWYSLASYVAAFEFNAGAIAYHIASSEAATLRDPESQVWCKRLLEEGVCVTLGPVDEPYLVAFPLPDEFFVSVLSGKYSLVESYYRTKPDSSWMMVLVGDPLYNPFANKPPIKTDDLPSRYHRVVGE